MSQSAIDITLPDGWEAVPHPLAGASLQAYEPAGPAIRSSITVYAFVPEEISDTPPEIEELHAAQIDDMVQTLPGGRELSNDDLTVNGLYAKCAVIGFRSDEHTVMARVWTIQAFNGVLQVAGICDAQRVATIGPLINLAVDSLRINVDPNFVPPARPARG